MAILNVMVIEHLLVFLKMRQLCRLLIATAFNGRAKSTNRTPCTKLLNQQGVTTIMDARVGEPQLRAFNTLREAGDAGSCWDAVEITPDDVADIAAIPHAVQAITRFTVKSVKARNPVSLFAILAFLDGVLHADMTACLLAVYALIANNVGTDETPHWQIQSMLAISIFHLKSWRH